MSSSSIAVKPDAPRVPYPRQSDRIAKRSSATFLLTCAAGLVALVAWASTTEIDKVTRGSGRVVPQQQNQIVQHFEGGIVAEILAKEGERVERGTPLMRIENRFANAELQQSVLELKAKTLKMQRLQAESQGDKQLNLDPDLVAAIPKIAARERALFSTRQETLAIQVRILSDQYRQKELNLSELRSRWISTKSERELIMQRLTNLRRLAGQGGISNNELLDNERGLQQMDAKLSDLTHDIPRTESELSETGSKIKEATLRFQTDAERDRTETELQMAKLQESISALQDRKSRSEVLAPITGVVNKLFVNTLGGVVKSGEPLVQIVPADQSITIEARLSPADRAKVWLDLPAVVKVSAYDFSIFGGIEGKVVDISPDILQDEKGQPYFRVRLQANSAGLGSDKPILPGMLADVDIISGKQTIMSALVRPVRGVAATALRQ